MKSCFVLFCFLFFHCQNKFSEDHHCGSKMSPTSFITVSNTQYCTYFTQMDMSMKKRFIYVCMCVCILEKSKTKKQLCITGTLIDLIFGIFFFGSNILGTVRQPEPYQPEPFFDVIWVTWKELLERHIIVKPEYRLDSFLSMHTDLLGLCILAFSNCATTQPCAIMLSMCHNMHT